MTLALDHGSRLGHAGLNLDALTARVLFAMQEQFDNYVCFPSAEARDAAVLWAAHTHVYRSFEASPRLSVRSDDPGSGKSRVLDVIKGLAANARVGINITPAVMWRLIDKGSPTLLIDEVDTVFGKNGSSSSHENLRGIINHGHHCEGVVPRCVGSTDVKDFSVFAPVAMAGLGRLPETIATRSVEIVMRKPREGSPPIAEFRSRDARPGLKAAKLMADEWAGQSAALLSHARPKLPVRNRAADVWEPLVAIADMAGGTWPARARRACKTLCDASAGELRSDDVPDGRLRERALVALTLVNARPDGVKAAEIAEMLAITADMAGRYLRRLVKSGRIIQDEEWGGKFRPLPSEVSEVSVLDDDVNDGVQDDLDSDTSDTSTSGTVQLADTSDTSDTSQRVRQISGHRRRAGRRIPRPRRGAVATVTRLTPRPTQ